MKGLYSELEAIIFKKNMQFKASSMIPITCSM